METIALRCGPIEPCRLLGMVYGIDGIQKAEGSSPSGSRRNEGSADAGPFQESASWPRRG